MGKNRCFFIVLELFDFLLPNKVKYSKKNIRYIFVYITITLLVYDNINTFCLFFLIYINYNWKYDA